MTAVAPRPTRQPRPVARATGPVSRAGLRCWSLLAADAVDAISAPDLSCQLLAGHSGPHAVLFLGAERRRTVRSWDGAAPQAWVDSHTAFQRPWAPGLPTVAWTARLP